MAEAAPRSEGNDPASTGDHEQLEEEAKLVGGDSEQAVPVNTALDDRLLDLMMRHADRGLASIFGRVLPVIADRERARFDAWHGRFPRSWGPDPTRRATFREVAAHVRNVAVVFIVVNLDPRNEQHEHVRMPTRDLGIPQDSPYPVHDLLTDAAYTWRGEWNDVRLELVAPPLSVVIFQPAETPAS